MNTQDPALEWKGWHRSASELLLHASSETDASRTAQFAAEAVRVATEATKSARNQRQRDSSVTLLNAAAKIEREANNILVHGGALM